MAKFRKVLFWAHLMTGIAAGTVVLIMAFTGVLLAFESQIMAWAERDVRHVTPPAGASHLTIGELASRVAASREGQAPSSITFEAGEDSTAVASFGRNDNVYVNPYTGEMLGAGAVRMDAFLHGVEHVHRWLSLSDAHRDTGKLFTGACNLAFLFIVVSGLYLWWPKRWTKRALAGIALFNRGLSGKARDWNWHNVIGLWCCVPLFFIVLSGVFFSYPWATSLLYRVTGNEPPAPRQRPVAPPQAASAKGSEGPATNTGKGREGERGPRPGGERGEGRPREAAPSVPNYDGLQEVLNAARAEVPGWQTLRLNFPSGAASTVELTIAEAGRGRPDKRQTLKYDRATATLSEREVFADQILPRRLRTWARWVHTGEAGGLPGQMVAALASAGACVLVWTGFALTFRRWDKWRRERKAAAVPQSNLKEAKPAATEVPEPVTTSDMS